MNRACSLAVQRWPFVLAVVCLVVACSRDAPVVEEASEAEAVPTLVAQRVTSDGAFANPEFVGDHARGPWALRLWIGLWCDHKGHPPGGSDFSFFVDGVPLYRLGGECALPTSAPGSRPNGGAFAFTLEQGAHRLRVVAPDGSVHDHAFEMAGDRWLAVEFVRDAQTGAPSVAFSVYPEQLVVDRSYNFETAPAAAAVEAYARGERTQDDGYRRPSGALVAQTDGQATPEAAPNPRRATVPARRAAEDEGWSDAAMGTLGVTSEAPASVWIDGEDTGARTPVERMPLRMGRYRVELRDVETGVPFRQFSVEIQPGRHRTLVHAGQ
jgi:hypothetical protein